MEPISRARHSIAADSMDEKSQTRSSRHSAVEGSRIAHIKPRPGRRRGFFSHAALQSLLTTTTILYAALYTPSLAAAVPTSAPATTVPSGEVPLLPPVPGNPNFPSHWVPLGEPIHGIVFDHGEAPASDLYPEPELHKRQIDAGSSSSSDKAKATASPTQKAADASSSLVVVSVTETVSASPTDSGGNSSATATSMSSPLPKPFDGGLGTNFTQPSCPEFLNSMMSNSTFVSCLPFSVLLQNSMSFFVASRSVPTITQTLDASCNVVQNTCSALMSSNAINLRSPSYCSDDYNRQNPIVRQAYNGLLAYDVLYRASCEHAQPSASNKQSSDYCFADAVTNTSAPTDSYIYYLPLGIPLPAGTQPTCDQCLKTVMADFQTQAGNQSQPISLTYTQGAQLVNQQCGPNFVNQSAPSIGGGGGRPMSAASPTASLSKWLGPAALIIGAAPFFL